jgi:hypothetical protein
MDSPVFCLHKFWGSFGSRDRSISESRKMSSWLQGRHNN